MGIRGLTTYMDHNSQRYLKYCDLHDTYLIIDGNNIAYQIYKLYTKSNCLFGGDYNNYSECVSKFFDDLLKCNITPLVIFDGATESKKLRLVINRCKEKMETALKFDIHSQRNMKHNPLFTQRIFISLLKEKNIRHVQDLMEADTSIATLAMALNCPVLSFDSDFYIYDISYIPFHTLCTDIIKSSTGYNYIKCKIYKLKYLVQNFDGLSKSMIPLLATLLGNDYVHRYIFSHFFHEQKLIKISNIQRVEKILHWLCYFNLNNAITSILNKLPIPIRQKTLNIIVTNINYYNNPSIRILIAFNFPKNYITQISTYYLTRKFEFNGDIKLYMTCNNQEVEVKEEQDIINKINNLPQWFLRKYQTAMLPSYFMNLIVHRLYIPFAQIEDSLQTPAIKCSLKLIRILFGFLKSLINNEICYMTCILRIKNEYNIQKLKLKCIDTIKYGIDNANAYKFSSLVNFEEVPLILKTEVFNCIMNIEDVNCINELPQEWMLYVISIKYWIQEQENPSSYRCYLYSLFICMLLNIIDFKIGKYRTMNTFLSKYYKIIEAISEERKKNDHKSCNVMINNTIIKDYNEIDYHDCLLAAPFCIPFFKTNEELLTNPKKFRRHIVHKFSEFQLCLIHIMDLNQLLGCPYPQTKIENVFHGTFLYNLCNDLERSSNIDEYININFHISPSLLKLFNQLKMKPIFSFVFQDKISVNKK